MSPKTEAATRRDIQVIGLESTLCLYKQWQVILTAVMLMAKVGQCQK